MAVVGVEITEKLLEEIPTYRVRGQGRKDHLSSPHDIGYDFLGKVKAER